jgi:hypothetical protein
LTDTAAFEAALMHFGFGPDEWLGSFNHESAFRESGYYSPPWHIAMPSGGGIHSIILVRLDTPQTRPGL